MRAEERRGRLASVDDSAGVAEGDHPKDGPLLAQDSLRELALRLPQQRKRIFGTILHNGSTRSVQQPGFFGK